MKIAVLISGGVDSSAALYLLKEQGFEPEAFYIKVWMEEDLGLGDCPWREDVAWIEKVTARLGVHFQVVSLQREYWERVVEYTIREVRQGLTPNPDMMCNRLIKFGVFHEKYGKEFDRIATGHYAHTEVDPDGVVHLRLAADPIKDQTYFLSQMLPEQVAMSLFPIGRLTKKQVRALAQKAQLPNYARPDSQGICFLGKINFRDFLKHHLGERDGSIVELGSGKILGRHRGFWFYTIGQRSGLGLSGGPWFVVEKDPEQNLIYVANGYDPKENYKSAIVLKAFNWLFRPKDFLHQDAAPQNGATDAAEPVLFKIRHTPAFSSGTFGRQGPDQFLLTPTEAASAVAKGQFGVIYRDGECLGGGVIC